MLLLEFTRPDSRLTFSMAKLYLYRIVPSAGRLVSGRPGTRTMMKYFWDTIEQCVPPERILAALRQAGFDRVARRGRLGLMSEYLAQRPSDASRASTG